MGSPQDYGLGAQIWGWSCCSAWPFSSESLLWELGANSFSFRQCSLSFHLLQGLRALEFL